MALIIWFIFVDATNKAQAGIILGAQLADLKPSKYEYIDNSYNINNIKATLGIFKKSGNLSYTLSTNRLTNPHSKRKIRVSNNLYQSITKITIDSLGLSYAYNRYMIGYNVSRVDLNNRIIVNENNTIDYNKISLVNSFSIGYYINSSVLVLVTNVLPSKELQLNNSFIFGINLLF